MKELNAVPSWREVYGPINNLMRDQELILRFLALYFEAAEFTRPMKGFLNTFMGGNKHLGKFSRDDIRSAFIPAIQLIHNSIGKKAFRLSRAFNAAIFDAVMVGVARRLQQGSVSDLGLLKQRYGALLANRRFLDAAERATADEESVAMRIKLATDAFADIT